MTLLFIYQASIRGLQNGFGQCCSIYISTYFAGSRFQAKVFYRTEGVTYRFSDAKRHNNTGGLAGQWEGVITKDL